MGVEPVLTTTVAALIRKASSPEVTSTVLGPTKRACPVTSRTESNASSFPKFVSRMAVVRVSRRATAASK